MPACGSAVSTSTKRDYRGEQVDFRNEVVSDTNREVNEKLSALSKVLTDATALLRSAGLSTGKSFEISPSYHINTTDKRLIIRKLFIILNEVFYFRSCRVG